MSPAAPAPPKPFRTSTRTRFQRGGAAGAVVFFPLADVVLVSAVVFLAAGVLEVAAELPPPAAESVQPSASSAAVRARSESRRATGSDGRGRLMPCAASRRSNQS